MALSDVAVDLAVVMMSQGGRDFPGSTLLEQSVPAEASRHDTSLKLEACKLCPICMTASRQLA